jgi:hypothetical protein
LHAVDAVLIELVFFHVRFDELYQVWVLHLSKVFYHFIRLLLLRRVDFRCGAVGA